MFHLDSRLNRIYREVIEEATPWVKDKPCEGYLRKIAWEL